MSSDDVFEEFIDDYFAECEEHLRAMRGLLLDLEARPVPAFTGPELQELARRLHTIKGLSGMVGLESAVQVSHALEDVARGISDSDRLTPEVIEALFSGVGLLDRCLHNRRLHQHPPAYDDFVRGARALASREAPVVMSGSSALAVQPPTPIAGEATLYRFAFVPSAEQAARGIGVELVRRRLQELGEIVRTVPRVGTGGTVTFEFEVSVPAGRVPPEPWRADGVTWERVVRAAALVADDIVAPPGSGAAGANMVRVELARVDDLMRTIGEMVVLRSRLDESLRRVGGNGSLDDLRETNEALERQLRALREGVMRIRLVPIGEVFERMRFTLRDMIRESGKAIALDFSGGDTEIDKLIVDRMLEPLLHLVRNAATHGIESRERRASAGKPSEGRITLRARAAGDRIVLETEDDGAGIDVERVKRRARDAGLVTAQRALSDDDLLDLICSPGFSTRDGADMASGRGVGMAVVRSAIRALGGELSMSTVPGGGTRFTIELPLTLMIADALLVEVGGQTMGVPQLALREILPLDPAAVTALENGEVISWRGGVLPLVRLTRVFNMTPAADARPHVLVVGTDRQATGLVVDRLIGLREIVVHPVTDPLLAIPGISAATELADGRVSLVLDVAALVRRARQDVLAGRRALVPEYAGGMA